MKSLVFVALSHFMTDVFEVLAKLSVIFQKEDLILPPAVCGVKSSLLILEQMKTDIPPNGNISKFISTVIEQLENDPETDVKFQGITLNSDKFTLSATTLKDDLLKKFG